ncbi:flagellar hook-associated protein FlgK [Nocardioides anomalus]|uniref:Flagellar hook-associated protein 1 n=1 Tax=Nocardioides anomalus TaxID=2712223 RepID=A0A6G6WBE3_9ACTN|nr:flagellar hook-associated protein FlgK [Nocardioides anomalus]QIG42477.1 flagellar hook-associated protein FlgK [Nocardioides anomalus]
MTGTFSSFNTSLSALRYQRVAMDVASGNIANASTEGYVRRRAEAEALGAPAQLAMWSRYDGAGDGVTASGITRMADPLMDARSRREHGTQSYLDARVAVLTRVESALGEPGGSGVSAAMNEFRNAWQDLESNPDSGAARSQVLATGSSLAEALRTQAGHVTSELSDQRAHLLDVVHEVNSVAHDLATVNKSIAMAGPGVDDSDLRDQRDVLALRLSELTGGVSTVRPDGGIDVTVAGQPLVTGKDAVELTVTGGVAADGSDDGQPLALAVGGTAVTPGAIGGEAGAVGELLTTTLPAFRSGLDQVAKLLADSVNSLHTTGYDQDGNAGTPFFSYDPAGAASSLTVAITDPREVAASSQPGGVLDVGIAASLGDLKVADTAYQRVVSGLGTEVASTKRLATTQGLLTAQVDSTREQLTGVNLDEETVNLMAAQRAYEAAARVMSTFDSMLDTLINRTGA